MQNNFSNYLIIYLSLSVLLFVTSCKSDNQEVAQQQYNPEVEVAKPLKKEVIEWDEYIGRFQAVERVEVRARVSGYLDKILFTDGAMVEEGETLVVIDQRPFKIALDRAQARYELAVKDFQRVEKLRESRAISQEDFDSRLQEFRVAKADLDQAKLDVEFTQVKAPVRGRVSRNLVDVGNLVTGDTTIITTIVSQDPIHFYFEASEQDLLKYIRLDRNDEREASTKNANPVFVRLQDEQEYRRIGFMDFVDNEVDQSTGTILGRAVFENADNVIYPGLFGRARLLGSGLYEAFLIPDEALAIDQSRRYVMVVGNENKAERRYVEIGPLRDSGLRIIRKGLSEDDLVIINGIQRARPGTTVAPSQGKIEEPGEDIIPTLEADGSIMLGRPGKSDESPVSS